MDGSATYRIFGTLGKKKNEDTCWDLTPLFILRVHHIISIFVFWTKNTPQVSRKMPPLANSFSSSQKLSDSQTKNRKLGCISGAHSRVATLIQPSFQKTNTKK